MEQGHCPVCNSNDLSYETICDTGHDSACYPFECNICGFQGKEWYNLNFAGYEDMDGNPITKNNKDYCDQGRGCRHLGENTCGNSAPHGCYEERTIPVE